MVDPRGTGICVTSLWNSAGYQVRPALSNYSKRKALKTVSKAKRPLKFLGDPEPQKPRGCLKAGPAGRNLLYVAGRRLERLRRHISADQVRETARTFERWLLGLIGAGSDLRDWRIMVAKTTPFSARGQVVLSLQLWETSPPIYFLGLLSAQSEKSSFFSNTFWASSFSFPRG